MFHPAGLFYAYTNCCKQSRPVSKKPAGKKHK